MAYTFIPTDYGQWINLANIVYFEIECIRDDEQYDVFAYGSDGNNVWHMSSSSSYKAAEEDLRLRICE